MERNTYDTRHDDETNDSYAAPAPETAEPLTEEERREEAFQDALDERTETERLEDERLEAERADGVLDHDRPAEDVLADDDADVLNVPEQRSTDDAFVPVPAAVAADPAERTETPADPTSDIDFDQRWRDIKAGFVDDPRDSVEQADALIDEAVSALAARRQSLLDGWKNSDQNDTEQLRLALREYRSLFDKLKG